MFDRGNIEYLLFYCFYRHNFYVFPRQEIQGDGISNEFLCQTSSLEFLAKYQFDFNKCIYEGELLVSTDVLF